MNLLKMDNLYHTLFENNPDIAIYLNRQSIITHANENLSKLLGYSIEEILVTPFIGYLPAYEQENYQKIFLEVLNGESRSINSFFLNNNGKKIPIHIILIPATVENKVVGVFGIIKDKTETRKLKNKLYESEAKFKAKINFLAYYDQLTELPNRKSFEETLEKELVIAKTLNQKLAIMYLDLDRFKYINDTLGHHIGDKLLVAISKRLQIVLEDKDQLFRISGDEYAIICPDCNNTKIIELAYQIISSMEGQFEIDSYRFFITTSIGIGLFPNDGEDTISLMKTADAALHHAKREGKNTFKVYTSIMDIQTFKAFKLGTDIRLALENDELEYYFQPKVSTVDNKIVGAEALIRWNHPEWGILSPNEFIPIIEEQGLIGDVGLKMNWRLAKQIKHWQEAGLPYIPFSMNLSATQFLDKNLVSNFRRIIEDSNLDPEFIELEIVETSMLENEKMVLTTLKDLISTGITISLDDFGTGYSSLSYLTKFKKYINTLKIDRSFITHLSSDEGNETNLITNTMITLAESLKINVVAEGVETFEQYNLLKQMGCKVVQGYLISKPLPASEFEDLLKIGTINIPNAHNLENKIIEEHRKYFRIPLHFPLSGSMTITRINGRTITVGRTVILIEDIGLGGLRFLTGLKLTVNPNIILEFETNLFGETIQLLGSIVWANEIKPDVYQYGVEYVIDENERSKITPVLNKLAIKLRKAPLVQDCSFVTEDRYKFIEKLHK